MHQLFGRSASSMTSTPFWESPERAGWLMKQGPAFSFYPSIVEISSQESTSRHGVDAGLF